VFGLAVPPGSPQDAADAILQTHQAALESVLLAFALAVTRFQKVGQADRLNASQIKTLSLLAEGRTLAEIAALEGVHFRTIDKRLAAARRILAANNSVHAVVLAERSGQLIVVRD
jgi:DNA-binding CsgD family transcriptional regulator